MYLIPVNECMSTSFIVFKYDNFSDKLHMSRFSHQHHELFNGLREEREEKSVADRCSVMQNNRSKNYEMKSLGIIDQGDKP